MSRSGYSDDLEPADLAKWRASVNRALASKRGQAFLKELLTSLDALPAKRLIGESLQDPGGEVCSLGAVGFARKLPMNNIDPEAYWDVAKVFDMPEVLAQEIMYLNDEWGPPNETPEERFTRMRGWAVEHIGG